MRKHLLLLLLATLLPWSLWAQTLTVSSGTTTNSYLPFYAYYADGTQQSQIIYPEDSLTSMVGYEITQMVFYSSLTSDKAYAGNWKLRLGICADASFASTSYDQTTVTTEVYVGTLSRVGSSQTVTITFDSPFLYNGGNLLFDLRNYTGGSWESNSFYGSTVTGAGLYSSSGNTNTTGTAVSFLPKTTFSYQTPSTCPKPSALSVSNITANGASISWTAGGSETSWQYVCGAQGFTPDWTSATLVNTNPATITGLTPYAYYDVYVRAYCAGDDQSDAIKTSFMTAPDCGSDALRQFVIGTGTSSGNYVPFYSSSSSYYAYGASWQIFTADEIMNGAEFAGTIKGIALEATSAASIPMKVFMAHTTKATFTSGTDTISRATMTKVYDGTCSFAASGMTEIILD